MPLFSSDSSSTSLTLATWLTEVVYTLQIEHLVKYPGQRQVCETISFLDQFGSTLVIAFSLEITLLLGCQVYESLQRKFLAYDSWSKCSRVSVEVIAIFLAASVSLSTTVVSFIRGTYGLSGGWCWIRALNNDCKDIGIFDQNITNIPYAILGIMIGIFIVFFASQRVVLQTSAELIAR